VAETHKFESHYVERFVPSDQLEERSPLALVSLIDAPVLLFHGLDDKVVPPEQSWQLATALRRRGVEALVVQIEGEGHGFRRADSLVRAQEAELAFFGRALGLEPADDLTGARADLAEASSPEGATWSAGAPG
jgi:acetyl esterase/lipase